MESRILKQRGRHNTSSADTLQITTDYDAGEPNTDSKYDTYALSARGEGTSSKTYGAYPVGPTAQRDNGTMGNSYETITDFSAVSLSEGILGIMRSKDLVTVIVLTLLSMMTRLYRIGRSNRISWDESHFTYFGGKYLNHTFYHDVHPPLAKMLVALAQTLAGFNGSYDL
ncbi:Protein O-mannosyltransferase 2, partial [Coemansia sp. RSA 2611]